jgi:hypothetical protein
VDSDGATGGGAGPPLAPEEGSEFFVVMSVPGAGTYRKVHRPLSPAPAEGEFGVLEAGEAEPFVEGLLAKPVSRGREVGSEDAPIGNLCAFGETSKVELRSIGRQEVHEVGDRQLRIPIDPTLNPQLLSRRVEVDVEGARS